MSLQLRIFLNIFYVTWIDKCWSFIGACQFERQCDRVRLGNYFRPNASSDQLITEIVGVACFPAGVAFRIRTAVTSGALRNGASRADLPSALAQPTGIMVGKKPTPKFP